MRADKIQRFFSKMQTVFTNDDKVSHVLVGDDAAEAIIKDESGNVWTIKMTTPEGTTVKP